MADTLEQLILALAQADSAVAGSDPYASPQAAVEGIKWDPSGFGVGENAAASGIKGLLSGLFGELGNDYKQRAASEYQNVLLSSALGKGPKVENKVLPEDLFAKVQNRATIFDMLKGKEYQDADIAAAKEAAKEKAKQEAELDLYKKKKNFDLELEGGPEGKVVKEAAQDMAKTQQKLDVAYSFVDKIFDDAKELNPASKFFSGNWLPNTYAGERIKASGSELLGVADSIKGQEINDQSKKALLASTPAWNDTDATTEVKKQKFKELLAALAVGKNVVDPKNITSDNNSGGSTQDRAKRILKKKLQAQGMVPRG